MTILKKLDFPDYKFSLFFLSYLRPEDDPVPEDKQDRFAYALNQKAVLELTHNWGTEVMMAFLIMMETRIQGVLVI